MSYFIKILLLFLCYGKINGFQVYSLNNKHRHRSVNLNVMKMNNKECFKNLKKITFFGLIFTSSYLTSSPSSILNFQNNIIVHAVQGSIKTSSLEETKAAASLVKRCVDSLNEMEKAAKNGDYETVGKLMASNDFQNFENAATILVRSDQLTADEKVSLGTIKRYGVVADAIIMLGGINGELKAGGINYGPTTTTTLQKSIEDDSDDDSEVDTSDVKVNPTELKKYISLSKGSFADIYKIVQPILSR